MEPITTKPSMTLRQLERRFQTEESCRDYLVEKRWNGTVACPKCSATTKIYKLKTRAHHWICKNAGCGGKNGYRFSVLTGTIFENTNVPLRTWFRVIYLMTQSKKGISALQVHRLIDPVRGDTGSYRTAWYMCHRIRAAMLDPEGPIGGGDVVEVDETYVGGKDRNRHKGKRSSDMRERARLENDGYFRPGEAVGFGKVGVIGAIARKGNVVARVIGSMDARTKSEFVQRVVSDKVELLATDKDHAFKYVGLPHEAVDHSQGEYVRGIVHTNTLEGFWALLKRGIMGSYHHVSKEYLPLYLNEFSWRYNQRKNPDIFEDVLSGC